MIIDEQKGASFMSDVNKNLVGDTERTSILSRSGEQAAEQTEVFPPTCLR